MEKDKRQHSKTLAKQPKQVFYVSSWVCISSILLIGDPLQYTVENKIIRKIKESKFSNAKEIKKESQRQVTDIG